jgi:hypothetical protein
MIRTFRLFSIAGGLLLSASMALAGTQVSGSIVPANPDVTVHPQVGAKSTYSFRGKEGKYAFHLKGITDASGMPAPITSGGTSDTMYIAIVRIEALGQVVNYNIPFNITKKAGQETVKGAASLVSLVPGAAVGISGVVIYQPTPPANAPACDAILFDPALPGVYLGDTDTNPCAGGMRIGVSGIVAGS